MNGWEKDRIGSALAGTNPTVLAKMKSGFAVFGDTQFLPGYCVLLAHPKVNSLNDLTLKERAVFLTDMTIISDAISQVYQPIRINYNILGNTDAFLHAHIFPRYEWEEEQRKVKPVWLYPGTNWSELQYQFSQEKFCKKRTLLEDVLKDLIKTNYNG